MVAPGGPSACWEEKSLPALSKSTRDRFNLLIFHRVRSRAHRQRVYVRCPRISTNLCPTVAAGQVTSLLSNEEEKKNVFLFFRVSDLSSCKHWTWFNVRSFHSSSWLNVNTIATFLNTIKQFTSVCGLFIWQHVLVCFKTPLSTEVLIFQKQKIPWQIKLLWAPSCFSKPRPGTFGGTLLFAGSKFSSGVFFFLFSLSPQKSPCSEINAFQMFQGLWKHFWLARLFLKMNEEARSGWTDEVQARRTPSNDITPSLWARPLHQKW